MLRNYYLLKPRIYILNIFVVIILFVGAIMSPSILWDLVDIGAACLAIINVIGMLLLHKEVKREYDLERSKL